MKLPSRSHWVGLFLAASLVAMVTPAGAQGIPEPPLVLYGTIRNTADNNIRLIAGRLNWQLRNTATGRTVDVSGQITNILDQFSYVLQVPCETELLNVPISSNALALTPLAATFDRSLVTLTSGVSNYPATILLPSSNSFNISSTNRGRIERVDLTVQITITDPGKNGLPDEWEFNYFGFIGVDPNGDDDLDGMSNMAEYRAGTNPTDPLSRFAFINYFPHPNGGFQVEWSSAEGRFYNLERSPTLLSGSWTSVRTNISATPPTNRLHDSNAPPPGPYFYRLRLDQ